MSMFTGSEKTTLFPNYEPRRTHDSSPPPMNLPPSPLKTVGG